MILICLNPSNDTIAHLSEDKSQIPSSCPTSSLAAYLHPTPPTDTFQTQFPVSISLSRPSASPLLLPLIFKHLWIVS